ncbi:MAG: hypothetical protein OZ917_12340, partial [Candidatus Brocadiaceae bacterium]|nr:hypothetical protein [Candidatus Brocadiaceae bacterium]
NSEDTMNCIVRCRGHNVYSRGLLCVNCERDYRHTMIWRGGTDKLRLSVPPYLSNRIFTACKFCEY